jgi:hypothetical protein
MTYRSTLIAAALMAGTVTGGTAAAAADGLDAATRQPLWQRRSARGVTTPAAARAAAPRLSPTRDDR